MVLINNWWMRYAYATLQRDLETAMSIEELASLIVHRMNLEVSYL